MVVGLLAGCGGPPRAARRPPGEPGPGTRRMAERLETITRTLDPVNNRFLNAERVRVVRESLARTDDPRRRTRLNVALAEELLKTGSAEQAIAMMQPYLDARARTVPGAPSLEWTRRFLALASYRMGIQQNCGARPNAARCILPLGRDGIHESPRGTRAAMALWAGLLRDDPGDLAARWLYNIGAMTVGDYPDGVPRAWLIPEEVFAPEAPFPPFRNVAPIAGLDAENHAGGALMEDFDGDGLLDVMVSSMQPADQLRLFRNDGDGRFTEVTEAAGLHGETGGLNLVHADYDNDGDPDVLLLRGGWMRLGGRYPKSLLRNDGGMSFEDVTEEAGLLSFHPTQTAAWGDYDGDGWLDLMVGNESSPPFDPHPSELFRNNGDGTFSDRSANLGETEMGYVKGVVWGDYDNDGRQDLFVSVLGGDNQLLRNEGPRAVPGPAGQDWVFTDVADRAGVREPLDSFATWFWDYDNDGWLDLLVDGYLPTEVSDFAAMYLGRPTRTPMPRLYRNQRDGTFADVSRATRIDRVALPMGANYGDLDNDGWPDPYFGTGQPNLDAVLPNRLFRNDGGRLFQDVTLAARVGHLQKGHGIAFGDIDNDGDQDLFAQMGGFYDCDVARNVLFENPGGGGTSITLRLQGRRANRAAIGARIRVRVVTPRGPRDLFALAGTGGSFGGNSLQQEIGLGDATAVMEIEVRWPGSDRVQTFRGAGAAGVYRIVEGREALEPVEVRSFRFPAPERSASTRLPIER